MKYDAIVIGGGAAGLFCAFQAGRRRKNILVIEHNADVGRKIVISGGGRCNFTNTGTGPSNFISQNPHFAKSALSQYTPEDFISLVRKHRIAYYEKKLGQIFCRESSRQIVDLLVKECGDARVNIVTGCTVSSVSKNESFELETSKGRFEASNLVVACGGLSFPKIGASDLGYRIAKQFGLKLVDTRPSLVALVKEGSGWPELAGVAVDSTVSAGDASFRENILFTHRGLSGPAVLQVSNYWRKGEPVLIDLLPGVDAASLRKIRPPGGKDLANYLSLFLPQRLARHLIDNGLPNRRPAELTRNEWEQVGRQINKWRLRFSETEGYGRAEVTLGGVSTRELSSKTMESSRVPGLYFIGEVVDVTGWLGGYNFQWAWSSGFAAGRAI